MQVVAGDTCASSPRAPCRFARVSMKPRCRLHEPIRFINCSTSSFYSSTSINKAGGFPPPTSERRDSSGSRARWRACTRRTPCARAARRRLLSMACTGKRSSTWRLTPTGWPTTTAIIWLSGCASPRRSASSEEVWVFGGCGCLGGRSLDESALSGFAASTTHICLLNY